MVTVAAASLVLTGCSSVEPPRAEIAAAALARDSAEAAGAGATAQLEIEHARRKLERAQALVQEERASGRDERYLEARRLAEQALIDARLAEERARLAATQASVDELRRSLVALERELNRDVGVTPATSYPATELPATGSGFGRPAMEPMP